MAPNPAGPPVTGEAPCALAAPWGGRGFVTDLDGPVHWVEFGRPTDAPPILFVHGLGGSHLNWALVNTLGADRRALAPDLRGFGLTPGTRRTSTVAANAALVNRFVREVVGEPVILVGNSMGGLISVLQADAHPETVAGVALIDPVLPQLGQRPDPLVMAQFCAFATPGVGELSLRAARLGITAEQLVRRTLLLCFADASRADERLLTAAARLAELRAALPGADAAFLAAARSTVRTAALPRAYLAAMRRITAPVLLINGEADRLISIRSARRAATANPSWSTRFLPGVGHTPQLEVPGLVVDTIREWLSRYPRLRAGA